MKQYMLITMLAFFSCMLAMEQRSNWDAQLYDQHSKQQYEASLKYLACFDLSSLNL